MQHPETPADDQRTYGKPPEGAYLIRVAGEDWGLRP